LNELLVAPGLRVLGIGSGLGDLLAGVRPAIGIGIEWDPEVVVAARERHP
jgi:hypothetical protein